MRIFRSRELVLNSIRQTLFGIKKANTAFSLQSSVDICLYRANIYRVRKSDWFIHPIRTFRFYFARLKFDNEFKNDESRDEMIIRRRDLTSTYSKLLYGENICESELQKLILLEINKKLTRGSIRSTLKNLNVMVTIEGKVKINQQSYFLRILGIGIITGSIPIVLFSSCILMYFTLSIDCTPMCAIVGGTELFLISAITTQMAYKIAFVNKTAQTILSQEFHSNIKL